MGFEKADITQPIVIFLTIPTDAPSGVSAGHITIICVLCNLRGPNSLPFFSIGVFTRRRCESVLLYVNLLNT